MFQQNYSPATFWRLFPITTIVLAAMTLLFFTGLFSSQTDDSLLAYSLGAMYHGALADGEVYRLFTYTFLHLDPIHFGINVLCFALFAPPLERILGPWKFSFLYLSSSFFGAMLITVIPFDYLFFGNWTPVWGLFGTYIGMLLFKRRYMAPSDRNSVIVAMFVSFAGFFYYPVAAANAAIAFASGILFAVLFIQPEALRYESTRSSSVYWKVTPKRRRPVLPALFAIAGIAVSVALVAWLMPTMTSSKAITTELNETHEHYAELNTSIQQVSTAYHQAKQTDPTAAIAEIEAIQVEIQRFIDEQEGTTTHPSLLAASDELVELHKTFLLSTHQAKLALVQKDTPNIQEADRQLTDIDERAKQYPQLLQTTTSLLQEK